MRALFISKYRQHLLYLKLFMSGTRLTGVGPVSRLLRDSTTCFVGPLVRWSVGPWVCQSVGPSVCQSIGPSVRQSISPLVNWFIHLSVRQFVTLYIFSFFAGFGLTAHAQMIKWPQIQPLPTGVAVYLALFPLHASVFCQSLFLSSLGQRKIQA